MLDSSPDREALTDAMSTLSHHLPDALENDIDLMTEVQSFWIEPSCHVPLLSERRISHIAVGVLRWLQVRPISSSLTSPFKVVQNDRLSCFS